MRDLLRESLLDEVVRGCGDIDVHVISAAAPGPIEPSQKPRAPPLDALPYGLALGAVAAATGLGLVGHNVLLLSDSIMLYLVGIMAVAMRAGRGPSLFAAAASVAAYNFFFVPPLFTFSVHDGRHVLAFATVFVVGAVLSALTVRIRQQERDARDREARTASLFLLSRDLSSATEGNEVAAVLCDHVARGFGGAVRVVTGSGADWRELAQAGDWDLDSADDGLLRWVVEHGRPAGLGTDTLPGSRALGLPMRTSTSRAAWFRATGSTST